MSREAIFQALIIAAILGLVAHVRDYLIFKTQVQPLADWWRKVSLDALKLATNPTSERLAELADRYIDCVVGRGKMSAAEKQELVDGLRKVMNDKGELAAKRQSASMSLRFIESREGWLSKTATREH